VVAYARPESREDGDLTPAANLAKRVPSMPRCAPSHAFVGDEGESASANERALSPSLESPAPASSRHQFDRKRRRIILGVVRGSRPP